MENILSFRFAARGLRAAALGFLALAMHSLPSLADTNVSPFSTDVSISDPCAVFNDPQSPTVTRVLYGEQIAMTLQGQVQGILVTTDNSVNLKFQINAHGDGVGRTSGIKYVLNGKALLKANITGNPADPNFRFSGKFKVDARLIGQGNAASSGTVAQGAQDNALMHFYVGVTVAGSDTGPQITKSDISTFSLECVSSPWTSQMSAYKAGTKTPVGRGFGDVWNKYAWSMKDFGGGMVVGTKNAYFDYNQINNLMNGNSTPEANGCYSYLTQIPSIYRGLACSELFLSGSGGNQSASGAAQTRFAEIWRYDYTKKTWTISRDDTGSQGFRIMETLGGKLYVGSDLGSFVTGIKLGSWNGSSQPNATWDFPGSRLLVSSDGKTFTEVGSCTSNGPCNSQTGISNPLASGVNISIRSLAAFGGKLYVGTFNTQGAELWSYDPAIAQPASAWTKIQTFASATGVTELRVFQNKLYIGLGGAVGTEYLYTYDGTGAPSLVQNLPDATGTLGVLKLFPSAKGVLFIGIANVNPTLGQGGFRLYTYDGSGTFATITENGFFNPLNAYAWSMNELNGRVFVGTFNSDFFQAAPRGSAELWYSDDLTNWQQQALPVNWGLWNYGIRTMEIGNKQFFLGTASNVVAPDVLRSGVALPPGETFLSPGTEVWTIRATTLAPK